MIILITGCNGFVARNLTTYLSKSHTIIATDRSTLNVLSEKEVSDFLDKNNIDIVIHTAVSGGRRTNPDSIQTLINNLKMFHNLLLNKDKFKALIHFGSGAEFDRRTDISLAKEGDESNPIDYYGLSKKIINREILKIDNFYNLRIFGCFGEKEDDHRFIKSCFQRIKESKPILIHQNRYMDFISVEDLCEIVKYYVNNYDKKILQKEINLCYTSRVSLMDIAGKINNLFDIPLDNVLISKEGYHSEYTGDGTRLSSLNLNLNGLDKSLKKLMLVY